MRALGDNGGDRGGTEGTWGHWGTLGGARSQLPLTARPSGAAKSSSSRSASFSRGCSRSRRAPFTRATSTEAARPDLRGQRERGGGVERSPAAGRGNRGGTGGGPPWPYPNCSATCRGVVCRARPCRQRPPGRAMRMGVPAGGLPPPSSPPALLSRAAWSRWKRRSRSATWGCGEIRGSGRLGSPRSAPPKPGDRGLGAPGNGEGLPPGAAAPR